jgi:hypothetical protein
MSPRRANSGSVRLVALCGFAVALPLLGQPASGPNSFGDVIEVRTGFVRVTLPSGTPAPRAEEFEVLWNRQPQKILRIVGGAADPLEVGIAVDRSASMHNVFEPMRQAARELVERGFSEQDRLFVVGFHGRGAPARRRLAALPCTYSPPCRRARSAPAARRRSSSP